MVPSTSNPPEKQLLYEQLLDALHSLFGGVHPGYRAIHAKGMVSAGPLARLRTRLPSAVLPISNTPRRR